MSTAEETFRRQSKIYDPEVMNLPVTIVGCGSLGSWIGVALSKLGLEDFTLYDRDVVEAHNLPNQVFNHETIGSNKAGMLRRLIQSFAPYISDKHRVEAISEFWDDTKLLKGGLIINAPDDIDVRKAVAEAAPKESFIIDVRSGVDSFNIYCCDKRNKEEWDYYNQFFFEKKDQAGSDCNAQATVYNSLAIAALVVNNFVRYARGEEYPLSIDGQLPAVDVYPVFKADIKQKATA